MGTLRTQAPSRPKCRSSHVSHWPLHCPHSTAQPLPSPLPRAWQMSGKGWRLWSRVGSSLCPSPSAPECKPPTLTSCPALVAIPPCPPHVPLHHQCSASPGTSLEPGAQAGKAAPHTAQHCLLLVWLHPHSHATVPFASGISSPRENANGSELSSAEIPSLGLRTFCDTILEQPWEQPQEGKPW